MESIFSTQSFTRLVLTIIPVGILIAFVMMCNKSTEQEPNPFPAMNLLATKKPIVSAYVPMAGDTIYRPIAWGAELRVVPGVIYAGNHPKFGKYWFTKSMAYSRVKPANYMQDSIRERVAFADSVLITNLDTFYICRRVIY